MSFPLSPGVQTTRSQNIPLSYYRIQPSANGQMHMQVLDSRGATIATSSSIPLTASATSTLQQLYDAGTRQGEDLTGGKLESRGAWAIVSVDVPFRMDTGNGVMPFDGSASPLYPAGQGVRLGEL